MADSIEKAINTLTDMDALWWPFLSWRPKPTALFTESLILRLLGVGLSLGALLLVFILWMTIHPKRWDYIATAGLVAAPLSYVFLKHVLAWAWNRRALRAKGKRGAK
jgi:hypothetical protein